MRSGQDDLSENITFKETIKNLSITYMQQVIDSHVSNNSQLNIQCIIAQSVHIYKIQGG